MNVPAINERNSIVETNEAMDFWHSLKSIIDKIIINKRKTNWYVITGGPGSGKTTTVNLLRARGYITTIEHARHYLDTQLIGGRTVNEVRSNQQKFQLGVLQMQIEQEDALSPADLIFLDRAIPDAVAYYYFLHIPIDEELLNLLSQVSYKKVFILDILPMVNDYARIEDAKEQKSIHETLTRVYESLPFPVVRVPILSPEERVDFILNRL